MKPSSCQAIQGPAGNRSGSRVSTVTHPISGFGEPVDGAAERRRQRLRAEADAEDRARPPRRPRAATRSRRPPTAGRRRARSRRSRARRRTRSRAARAGRPRRSVPPRRSARGCPPTSRAARRAHRPGSGARALGSRLPGCHVMEHRQLGDSGIDGLDGRARVVADVRRRRVAGADGGVHEGGDRRRDHAVRHRERVRAGRGRARLGRDPRRVPARFLRARDEGVLPHGPARPRALARADPQADRRFAGAAEHRLRRPLSVPPLRRHGRRSRRRWAR